MNPRALKGIAANVYTAVRDAGRDGLRCGEVCKLFPSESDKAIYQVLTRLRARQFIVLEERYGPYKVVPGCTVPGLRSANPCEQLLALINDCPGGIAVAMLQQETGLAESLIQRFLKPDTAAGRVRLVQLASQHGGGFGYVAVERAAWAAAQAADVPHALAAGSSAPADGMCRFADGRASFELLGTGQYVISCGDSFQVKLPRDVTRSMFRHLDMLGGLHNEALLPAAAAEGEPACG